MTIWHQYNTGTAPLKKCPCFLVGNRYVIEEFERIMGWRALLIWKFPMVI